VAASSHPRIDTPAIRAFGAWPAATQSGQPRQQLLSERERLALAAIAKPVRLQRGQIVYQSGDPATSAYVVSAGAVKTFRAHTNGREHITAFLFSDDAFGLAHGGLYENSARTLTPVFAYQLPVAALTALLRTDALLEFHLITKLCHELRQAQGHAFLLTHRHTHVRLAAFLKMIERQQFDADHTAHDIYLPMSRSDIADYIGSSLSAVSRAFRSLSRRGILGARNRRHVNILDRPAFEMIARSV